MAPTKQVQEMLMKFGEEARARQHRRDGDDFRVKKQRQEKLGGLKAKFKGNVAAERKRELAAFAEADLKLKNDRFDEDGEIFNAFIDKFSKVIADESSNASLRSAMPEALRAVGEATGHASESKLQTPAQDGGQFSQIAPMPETPQAGELSFAERRRRNQEINLGIMANISPPTPTSRKSASTKKIKASTLEGAVLSNPEHDVLRRILISEVGTYDMIVEFPLFSQQFYVLKCTVCQTSFGTVGAMDLHVKHYRHGSTKKEANEEYTVSKFGLRVTDATVKWVEGRQGKMQRIEGVKDVGTSAAAVGHGEVNLDGGQLSLHRGVINAGDHSSTTADIKVQRKNIDFSKGFYSGLEADGLKTGSAPRDVSVDIEKITEDKFVLSQHQRLQILAGLASE